MRFDGGKLKALRLAKNWDQHRLAEAARQHHTGITQSTISRYENGMEPTGRNAVALARSLDVEVGELYGDASAEADEESDPMADPKMRAAFLMFADLVAAIHQTQGVKKEERVA